MGFLSRKKKIRSPSVVEETHPLEEELQRMEEAVPERRRRRSRGRRARSERRPGILSPTTTPPPAPERGRGAADRAARGRDVRGRGPSARRGSAAAARSRRPNEARTTTRSRRRADEGVDLIAPTRLDFLKPQRGRPSRRSTRRRDRLRQPEGRRREDDDDPEPGRRLRRVRLPRPLHRPRPAGQPDDVPGHRPGQGRTQPLRRARQRHADLARSSSNGRSTSPSPRSTWPAPRSR